MRIFAAIMTQEEKTLLEERIVDVLKTVYDPEIPVNIYDLGMIYKIDVQDDSSVELDMTFTAPNCPAADYILRKLRCQMPEASSLRYFSLRFFVTITPSFCIKIVSGAS